MILLRVFGITWELSWSHIVAANETTGTVHGAFKLKSEEREPEGYQVSA